MVFSHFLPLSNSLFSGRIFLLLGIEMHSYPVSVRGKQVQRDKQVQRLAFSRSNKSNSGLKLKAIVQNSFMLSILFFFISHIKMLLLKLYTIADLAAQFRVKTKASFP